MTTLELGDVSVNVIHKNIKNVHLSVYPPNGAVRVSAPLAMQLDIIRSFVISKLSWIRKQQQKLRSQAREFPRVYVDRESHYYNGKRYQLRVVEVTDKPRVELSHKYLTLFVRPQTDTVKRQAILNGWYRQQLKQSIPEYIARYEKLMQVQVAEFRIKKMKTRWGTCNPSARRIWLNLELAKKPPQCLEYVVVHEMTHLLEPTHNKRFVSFMDSFLPQWKLHKTELNRLPVSH